MGNKGSKGKKGKSGEGAPSPEKAAGSDASKRAEEPVNSEPVIIDKKTLDAVETSKFVQEARKAAEETKQRAKRASEHADLVVSKTNEVIAASKVADDKAEGPVAVAPPTKKETTVSKAPEEAPLSVPIGHTTFSWIPGNEKCPIGHTNFSYGKTKWVSGVF